MKKTLLAALLGTWFVQISLAQPVASATHEWPIAEVPLRIEGRSARGANDSIRLGFPGVTLHLNFHGSALNIHVNGSSDDVFFNVFVDDRPGVRLRAHAGDGVYPVFQTDAVGDHRIDIVRRSESWEGTCEILGFETAVADQFLPPPPAHERKLEFIGDSITCGAAADTDPNDPLNGKTNGGAQASNASATFAKILAQRFQAECHLVSYGGRGVIRDWQGIHATNNAPQFYELALPDDPTVKWDQSSYVPDAIGICLGTNDFSRGIPDETDFVNGFVQFLQKIRRDSPNALIFLIQSPIVVDKPDEAPKRTVLAAYSSEIIHAFNDPKVFFAPVKFYKGVPHNGHPTAADHVSIANELEPLFRKKLGW
jgi:lysophospholipase L1-like esterase